MLLSSYKVGTGYGVAWAAAVTKRRSQAKQWQVYERRSSAAKDRACERLKILGQIEALVDAGMTKSSAIKGVADATGTSVSRFSIHAQETSPKEISRQCSSPPRL